MGGDGGEKEGEEMAIVKVQSNGMELKIFGASFLLFFTNLSFNVSGKH